MPDTTHSGTPGGPTGGVEPVAAIPLPPKPRITERRALGVPGLPFLLVALLVLAGAITLLVVGDLKARQHTDAADVTLISAGPVIVVGLIVAAG